MGSKGPGRVIRVLKGLEGGQRDYKGPGRVIEIDWRGRGGVIGVLEILEGL